MKTKPLLLLSALACLISLGQAAELKTPGDRMFAKYFESETKRLAKADLAEIKNLDDWNTKKNRIPQATP